MVRCSCGARPNRAGRRQRRCGGCRPRPLRHKGLRYPSDPPRVEEVIAVMRTVGGPEGGGLSENSGSKAPAVTCALPSWSRSERRLAGASAVKGAATSRWARCLLCRRGCRETACREGVAYNDLIMLRDEGENGPNIGPRADQGGPPRELVEYHQSGFSTSPATQSVKPLSTETTPRTETRRRHLCR